ncbi:hypothetical protein JCM3775_002451 [Rhodotorula graminis]|uniref:Rad4 beta-hairpin domain-containing protein n=1 Tax=Rhodotorula graminis (strain WP1) TaxID=578459 RepID=A0A0N8PZQ8_RHOGW|nr:uncharacterized protein RHOBADRAFT_55250 [Rhodotorula graminis WP1]KPV73005.1 hypothetical protein RHOBADRAFT_55250 [Rhodotorula graminis WP1]
MDDGSAASDTGGSAPSPHRGPAQPRASTSAARFPLSTTASPHPATDSHDDQHDDDDDDDDDEEAWDEVDIPQAAAEVPLPDLDGANDALDAATAAQRAGGGGIEIVISRASTKSKGKGKAKAGETARERMVRQERHKVHVLSLVATGIVRNKWLNDKELQARLVSLVPAPLLYAFTSITPQKYPNPRDRSRLFDLALQDLVSWWYAAFEVVPNRALRRRRPDDVDDEVAGWADEGERLRARVRTKLDKARKAGREPTGLTDPSKIPLYPWEEAPLLTGSQRTAALRRPDGQLPLTPDGAFIRAFLPASDTWEVLRPVAPPLSASTSSRGTSGGGGGKGALGSLYAAAAMLRGSADLQVQLLVALMRALDIPARLVVSLQAMEWRSKSQSGAAPKRGGGGGSGAKGRGAGKGKGRAAVGASTDDDTGSAASAAASGRKPPVGKAVKGIKKASAPETLVLSSTASEGETGSGSAGGRSAGGTRRKGPGAGGGWVDGQGKMAYKVPKVNLRRSSGPSVKVPGWKKEEELRRGASPDAYALATPPTQWIEAYTRYNKEWITVDPSRKRIRCQKIMEPQRGESKNGGEGNVLAYVVAYEEDGSVHDVTPRYARAFTNTTLKLRVPTSTKQRKDNDGRDWFAGVVQPWRRKFVLNRDREEEQELWSRSINEPFPTSIGGFKNHPNYVLEQHLHRDEALRPGARDYGLFKGEYRVFRRADVLSVKSAENWYRQGRSVRPDEIPRKFVKQRAVTINSRRKEEFLKMDGGEVDEQPLYSENQTDVYVPPPVKDGKVPKNNFGNIDLFVPSMLPEGAVHLPSKVAAKCAKTLGIDYAEAIIGFEFRQRRATPLMAGVVVAAEHAETLREAILNLEQSTFERELAKQQDRVLKRWRKLIQGLRIRQRLLDQFKDPEAVEESLERELKADKKGKAKAKPDAELSAPSSARSTPAPAPSAPSSAAPSPAAAPSPLRIKLPARGAKRAASASPPLPDDAGSSASDSRTPRKRVAAPSAATAPAGAGDETSGTSTSGRSLRVRMPVRPQRDEVVREEVEAPRTRRSTRASAAKARGKLVEENGASDAEEEQGESGAPGQEEEAVEGEGGGEGGGDSDYGFEYEDD